MKNRWPVNLSLFTVEPLDTAGFLKGCANMIHAFEAITGVS
jgi:hypothetical protein